MRRHTFAATTIAAIALAIGGCRETSSPNEGLASARARWSARAPASYDMVLSKGCECVPGTSGTAAISVRNGVVISRTYPNDGPVPPEYAAAFPAVPDLFDIIDAAVRAGTRPIDVKYDPIYGYPIRAALGNVAADAPLYMISNFTPR
jgi:hypothetical protein